MFAFAEGWALADTANALGEGVMPGTGDIVVGAVSGDVIGADGYQDTIIEVGSGGRRELQDWLLKERPRGLGGARCTL